MHKSKDEYVMEFCNEERPTLQYIKKETCKRFGVREKANIAILYNKDGI